MAYFEMLSKLLAFRHPKYIPKVDLTHWHIHFISKTTKKISAFGHFPALFLLSARRQGWASYASLTSVQFTVVPL